MARYENPDREMDTCPHCGARFIARPLKVYCSAGCQNRAKALRQKEREREERERERDDN